MLSQKKVSQLKQLDFNMKKFKNLFLSFIVIFLFELTFAKIANTAACTATNGVYSEAEIKSGCEILPELYEVTIYTVSYTHLRAHET